MYDIRTAAVIGSGVMGAQIAAQLANCGIPVILLDLPDTKGKNKNALADKAKLGLKKIKPSALYSQDALKLITTGNLEDHLKQAAQTDWIIEAIVEQPQPKLDLFAKLEPLMSDTTILSTNTSGIPLSVLTKNLKKDVQQRFIATHFFNPPRYLRLVEIILGPETSDETVASIESVLKNKLNKVPVLAKDVPCFIANRIGVHAMVNTLKLTHEFGLTIEEVDKLTGSMIGRPKTGTYKLADLVGLDTLGHIITNLNESLPETQGSLFVMDPVLQRLIDNKQLGRKSGAGFYKKEGREIKSLDFKSGEYREAMKPKFDELTPVFKAGSLKEKLQKLFATSGKGADAAKAIIVETLAYAAEVAPEVSNNLADVDRAMELGFAWDIGPFKVIDAIGKDTFIQALESRNIKVPEWVQSSTQPNNYSYQDNVPYIQNYAGDFDKYQALGLTLEHIKKISRPVQSSSSASLWEMGDDVLILEFHSKMNSQDLDSLKAVQKAVEIAEKSYRGLVIANQAPHFCAGANIGMLLMDAVNGEYENVEYAIKEFQRASMDIKYSSVPVVVSPHGMALGGGCEFVLHSNRPVISPETYMGLVEVGVGLLPAGGGTKELTIRASQEKGDYLNNLVKKFEAIATAKVSTSGKEAWEIGLMDKRAVLATNDSTRLDQAKAEVLGMSQAGYRPPAPQLSIPVLGNQAIAAFETGVYLMVEAGYASEHDQIIAGGIGRIMAGGSVSAGGTVDEDYLLDLEREEFLKLAGMKKSQQRIEHMLKKNKPLRN